MVGRPSRYASKALSRLDDRVTIGVAEIEAEAELQATRVMAVSYVGKRAMHDIAMISQLEQQFAAIIFLLIMVALFGFMVWTIWDAYVEARGERVERARRMRTVQRAEYELHRKASDAFRRMMRVAREQTDGCDGHR
jgi:hypothetical protein